MFGKKKDPSQEIEDRAGMMAQIKGLFNADRSTLLDFARKPIIDFVHWLREREHGPVDPAEIPIDIILHTVNEKGEPETKILTGKMKANRETVFINQMELGRAIAQFLAHVDK